MSDGLWRRKLEVGGFTLVFILAFTALGSRTIYLFINMLTPGAIDAAEAMGGLAVNLFFWWLLYRTLYLRLRRRVDELNYAIHNQKDQTP